MQRCGGNDGGTVGDSIVGKATGGIADDNLLLEEEAEPFRGVFMIVREGEGAGRKFAAIVGDGERDAGKIRSEFGANEVDGGGAFSVDPLAVDGIKSPGTIESESAGWADAHFRHKDWVERLDWMNSDVG